MILTKKVNLKISNTMKKYYINLGYNVPSITLPIVEINVEDLSKGCCVYIEVKCDVCGKINKTIYKDYRQSIDKYGYYSCHGICTEQKSIQTNIKKYGIEDPNQLNETKEKIKKIHLDKYGVDSHNKSEIVKNNKKQSCLEKYGVENPQQNINIFNKQQKSSLKTKNYKNLHYQGSYELDFLDKYYDKVKIKNGMTIRYKNNKIYFPDFYIPELNLIVEIKSNYTYIKDITTNMEKQKACIEQGYNFIFIVDKNYTEFEKLFFI